MNTARDKQSGTSSKDWQDLREPGNLRRIIHTGKGNTTSGHLLRMRDQGSSVGRRQQLGKTESLLRGRKRLHWNNRPGSTTALQKGRDPGPSLFLGQRNTDFAGSSTRHRGRKVIDRNDQDSPMRNYFLKPRSGLGPRGCWGSIGVFVMELPWGRAQESEVGKKWHLEMERKSDYFITKA